MTSSNFRKAALAIATTLLLWCASTVFATSYERNRLLSVIASNKLTETPAACLEFLPQRQGGYVEVEVRERHGGTCPGDLQTSPRLFTIRIDQQTGEMSSDAKTLDGSYLPLR